MSGLSVPVTLVFKLGARFLLAAALTLPVVDAARALGAEGEGVVVPPQPLPDNPQPPYPAAAREQRVEGTVAYRAQVSEEGLVLDVEIVEVPKEGLGFDETVRGSVMHWHFKPALADGVPVAGEYAGDVEFMLDEPLEHARIYSIRTNTAWTALAELLKELRFKFDTFSESDGIVVTRMRSFDGKDLERLTIPQATCQLFLYLPRHAEPARLYVRSRSTPGLHYKPGEVETWLYERFEERIGQRGRALPSTPERRLRLATELLGGETPYPGCPQAGAAGLPTTVAMTTPALIETSRVDPVFPATVRTAGGKCRVIFQAEITEDGVVDQVKVLKLAGHPDAAAASAQAISLWRYRPAMRGGCPTAVYFTIVTEFVLD